MKKYKQLIILINLLIVLGLFTRSVMQKETILAEGKLLLLELAPVDPRSLIQGDYMRLRYKIAANIDTDSIPRRGYFVVKIDSIGLAQKVRIQQKVTPIEAQEYLIEYTSNNRSLNIGAESYFFQEGSAEKYDQAKFGGLRVNSKGNSVLVGLYDKRRKQIVGY